eukprot:CAMPEP_0206579198 /NCGR_PEP_ID=MMETSP0325_2-20121206/32412_1 /ASSEMBLY_ACC=CAM_ASM_000347 /TAXON_ID=2866 /ORGANISM="Crypthecodinium cohnii, Strain Seligo" /LENGTH=85 /DNA_ID=CAMNT_0054084975 /DNA_START=465 /DNA_END=722 /DNA_ORIENTATION=+
MQLQFCLKYLLATFNRQHHDERQSVDKTEDDISYQQQDVRHLSEALVQRSSQQIPHVKRDGEAPSDLRAVEEKHEGFRPEGSPLT